MTKKTAKKTAKKATKKTRRDYDGTIETFAADEGWIDVVHVYAPRGRE